MCERLQLKACHWASWLNQYMTVCNQAEGTFSPFWFSLPLYSSSHAFLTIALPCTQACTQGCSSSVRISMQKVSYGNNFQDCSVQSIQSSVELCANAFFSTPQYMTTFQWEKELYGKPDSSSQLTSAFPCYRDTAFYRLTHNLYQCVWDDNQTKYLSLGLTEGISEAKSFISIG